MSTLYTIACDKKGPDRCNERVGPYESLEEAREAAQRARWKLSYSYILPDGDRCPAHTHIMDRIDWGSTA